MRMFGAIEVDRRNSPSTEQKSVLVMDNGIVPPLRADRANVCRCGSQVGLSTFLDLNGELRHK
jgi:hypothetical protein